MDWYSGIGVDDLIVPTNGGILDRLPSPDSWSKWGVNEPEMYESQYKCAAFGMDFTSKEDGFDAKSISNEVVMEEDSFHYDYYDHSTVSNNLPDFQLDQSGSGCADDIFVSSFQEDLPWVENMDESFGASYELPQGKERFDNRGRDMESELQNSSGDVLSLGSSRYLKTQHAFSPSSSLENDRSGDSDIVAQNMTGKGDPFIEDPYMKESMPSEMNCMSGYNDDETSEEEAVLWELKMIMNQLTDKTRMCFRDSLYRLAKNWDKPCASQNQHGDLFLMEIPPLCTLDAEVTRSETKTSTELETNSIDRAVASLMFNKMDFNVCDPPMAADDDGEIGRASKALDFKSNPNYLSDHQVPLGDAEVPIFGRTYQSPTENLKSSNGLGKKSLVLNFGSADE